MRIKKKLMSFLLAMTMLIPVNIGMASDKEWAAEGTFGSDLKMDNMTAAVTVSGAKAPAAEFDGRGAWTVKGWDWYYHTLYIALNGDGATGAGGKHVLVEVDYFDESSDGWFCIRYNSRDENDVMTRKERMTGSKKWKTTSFVLEAPTMANDFCCGDGGSGDFGISGFLDNDYSHSEIYIGAVRVKQLDEVRPAAIEVDFANDGHIYFSDEDPVMEVKIKNKVTSDYPVDLKLTFQDAYGENVYEQTDSVNVKSMGTITKNIPITLRKFGTYTIFVEASNEELGYRFSTYTEFSYVRLAEYQSDKFGICNHFAWNQTYRKPEIIYPLMRKAGVGWTRDEMKWEFMETTKGVFEVQPFQEHFLDVAEENNLKHLLIYYASNSLYTATNNTIPQTDEELEAYGRYVYELTARTKGRVHAFEYWNEYDLGNGPLENYDKLAKVTYENLKKANPDALAVGICAGGLGLKIIQTSFDKGAYEYMDDISYHKYAEGTPVEGGVGGHTQSVRELLNKYPGGSDMKIWLTEMGWTNGEEKSFAGFYNKVENARMLPQEYAIQMESGYVERMFYYDMIDDQGDVGYSEATFGMLEHYTPTIRKVPYAAKPVFVSMAAMNGFLGTPDFVAKHNFNDTIYAYHFTRREDGTQVAMIWNENTNDFLSLNLGTKNAKFYDLYGNEIEVIQNGNEYAFNVTKDPIYIVGDFTELKAGSEQVMIKEATIKAAEPQDTASIKFYKRVDKPLKVELDIQEGSDITAEAVTDFTDSTLEIPLNLAGKQGYTESIGIRVVDADGKAYYDGEVIVEFMEGIEVEGKTKLYQETNLRRWQMQLNIKSYFHGDPLKAKIEIQEPTAFAGKTYDLGEIKNGDNEVSFHLPEIPAFTSYKFKGIITLSNGYTKEVSMPIDFALSLRAQTPPTIDGKMEEGEWNTDGKIVSDREDQVDMYIANPPWGGVSDVSGNTYIMWDDDNLYLAFDVTDDIHSCEYDAGSIWRGDSVQFCLSYTYENVEGAGTSFTEFGAGLSPNGPVVTKFSTESGTTMSCENSEVAIVRNGNKTMYEVRIPWTEAVPEGTEIKANDVLRYSQIINDNDTPGDKDGKGRRCWVEFGSGIGRYKAVDEFARIRLVP